IEASRGELVVRAWPARRNISHQPFQSLLADAIERYAPEVTVREFWPRRPLQKADIWHWHWPDGVLNDSGVKAAAKLAYLLALMRVARFRRIPIVWTAHNLTSHMRRHPYLERVMWKQFTRHVSAVHYLSQFSRTEFTRAWPHLGSIPSVVTRFGVYSVPRPAALPNVPSDAFVVAFIGKISPYKGVTELVDAFNALPELGVHLLVAGDPDPSLADWVAGRQHRSDRETWIMGLLSEVEFSAMYEAADLVVLPYRAVTNSGSVMYALSAGKRVLAPALGSIPEIAAAVGGEWVMTYDGCISTEILASAISQIRRASQGPSPDLGAFQWTEVAAGVTELYFATCARAEGRGDAKR
ncbi:MAG: glycosyltransferase family 4 protein, partial [Rhodanobacter sp.]